MRTSTLPGAVVGLVVALGVGLGGCGPQPLSVQNHPVPPTADIADAWIQVPLPSATTTEAFMTITGPAGDGDVVRVTYQAPARLSARRCRSLRGHPQPARPRDPYPGAI